MVLHTLCKQVHRQLWAVLANLQISIFVFFVFASFLYARELAYTRVAATYMVLWPYSAIYYGIAMAYTHASCNSMLAC